MSKSLKTLIIVDFCADPGNCDKAHERIYVHRTKAELRGRPAANPMCCPECQEVECDPECSDPRGSR